MLSRSAQSLYWMGRYLERASRLCSLLGLQSEALVDRPTREIHFGWNRIYSSVRRDPPGGQADLFGDEEFVLADSFALADDMTFERSNQSSVLTCFALGRENARHTRHCISPQVWTCLNMAYLKLQQLNMAEVWRYEPREFYAGTEAQIVTFGGLAESTMYHDEGWSFMQLGRYIERIQSDTDLLISQLEISGGDEEVYEADWISLLRSFYAMEAYTHANGAEMVPRQALDLLVSDPLLPGSLCRSLDTAAETLDAMAPDPVPRTGDAARRLAGRLRALVRFEWPDRNDREKLLPQFLEHCRTLHDLVTAAYFDYAAEDAPRL